MKHYSASIRRESGGETSRRTGVHMTLRAWHVHVMYTSSGAQRSAFVIIVNRLTQFGTFNKCEKFSWYREYATLQANAVHSATSRKDRL